MWNPAASPHRENLDEAKDPTDPAGKKIGAVIVPVLRHAARKKSSFVKETRGDFATTRRRDGNGQRLRATTLLRAPRSRESVASGSAAYRFRVGVFVLSCAGVERRRRAAQASSCAGGREPIEFAGWLGLRRGVVDDSWSTIPDRRFR
jgi:hypothetical protein